MDDRRQRDGLPMKRPNQHRSKLHRVAVNPDWRAGYLAGRAGRPPTVPQGIKDTDAWRDGYATGLRPRPGGTNKSAHTQEEGRKVKNVELLFDHKELYIVADGVKVARREAETWAPLMSGWSVIDADNSIVIVHTEGEKVERKQFALGLKPFVGDEAARMRVALSDDHDELT